MRTSSTFRMTQKIQNNRQMPKALDLGQLKRQMLAATETHPALARIARDRLKEMSAPTYTTRIKNPMKGSLKKSITTLQPHNNKP